MWTRAPTSASWPWWRLEQRARSTPSSHIHNITAIQQHLAANQVTNVQVHDVALGAEPGQTTLFASAENAGGHSLASGSGAAIPVRVATLDSFDLRPAFIKIDVEGWEPQVLAGATETIRAAQPILAVESSWKVGDSALVYRAIIEMGYHVFRLARGKDVPSKLVRVNGGSLPRHDNLICFPA